MAIVVSAFPSDGPAVLIRAVPSVEHLDKLCTGLSVKPLYPLAGTGVPMALL